MWHDIRDPSHSTLTFQLKHEHYWCKRGPLVARIMADKTGKVFMTGYIEGFPKIWGGGTRLRKGRKKARQSRKTTAQSRLHSQGRQDRHPSQHRTMDLCCKPPLQLSLDTGCGIVPTATASETTTPMMLLTQKDSPRSVFFCFSCSIWLAEPKSDIHSLSRKGGGRKRSKNKRQTFQHHMERLAITSGIRCWQQKNQCMLDTYIVSSIMYASTTWAMKPFSKETCFLLTP